MNETNVFKNLINKDPAPGTSGRLKIVSHNKICLPGWILGIDKENTVITFNQLYKIYNLTTQIIYDILDLGLTDISQRPKCPVCGEVCKFSGIKYNKTCCKKDCLSKIVALNSQNKEESILDKEWCQLKQKILFGEVQQIDFDKLFKKKIKLLNSIIKESSEDALFSRLSKLDPNPGTKNRIQKVNDIFIFPGWISLDKSIVSEDGMIHIKEKSVRLIYSRSLCNPQILYDILQLGITDISQRPRCPICNSISKFKCGEGYYTTCGKKECIKKSRSEYEKQHPPFHGIFSKEHRKKISAGVIKHIVENPTNISGNHYFGYYGEKISKKMNILMKYDSNWESDFIDFCDNSDDILSFKKSPVSIKYKYNKKQHVYIPDFEITTKNGLKYLIEIKPNRFIKHKQVMAKTKAGRKYIKTKNSIYEDYIILTENDLYLNKRKRKLRENILDQKINI